MITVVGPYVLTVVVHLAQIMQSLNFLTIQTIKPICITF